MKLFNSPFPKQLKYILIGISLSSIFTILIFLFFFFPFRITGNSMYPSLKNSDRIIVIRKSKISSFKRFDIVVTKAPDDNSVRIVKRIIGLPHEIISIEKGDIFVNGKRLKQPFLIKKEDVISRSENLIERKIPAKSFFILGDNRNVSRDSRSFGPVMRSLIVGKILFRYWPLSEFGKVQ